MIRYVALLLTMVLVACGSAQAMPVASEPEEPGPIETDIVAESHLYCLALAVYFEGGSTGETIEGQQYIARVVTERARERRRKWGGGDICDVVFYKRAEVCQFTFACLPKVRRTPNDGPRWRQAVTVARDELESASARLAGEMRYYMNPALTSDRNACRFRKEFVPVGRAGRHEFFREPTEAERAEIAVVQHAECVRYQAALEAQRRKAKAAAEKKRLAAMKKKAKRSRLAKR
jgi:Cell Wall Hydrolase